MTEKQKHAFEAIYQTCRETILKKFPQTTEALSHELACALITISLLKQEKYAERVFAVLDYYGGEWDANH